MSMRPGSRCRVCGLIAVFTLGCGLGLTTADVASASEPQAPAAASQRSLARYFSSQDLVAYVEFDGLDHHAAAWKKTAAARLLNETTTGAMYEAMLPRVLDATLSKQSDASLTGKELTLIFEHLAKSGFAIGINRAGGAEPPRCFGLVFRGGARGDFQKLADRILRAGAGPRAAVRDVKKTGGRTIHELGRSPAGTIAWWTEGDDLVVSLVAENGALVMIDALDGRAPNAIAHRNRQALLQSEDHPGFEPVGLAFFDMAALPTLPPAARSLGLGRIKRFDYRWGFQDDALLSIVGAVVPAPRKGIPAMFDQPTFSASQLPPLPVGVAGFTVVSVEEQRLAPLLRESLGAISGTPPSDDPGRIDELIRAAFGVSLHDEFFAYLGTRFTIYNVASRINAPSHALESLALGLFRAPKMALVAEVKHRDLLAKSLEKMVDHANENLRGFSKLPNGLALGEIKRLKNGESGYIMSFAGSEVPISSELRPTLLLGQKSLVLASTPALARRARDLAENPGTAVLQAGDPLRTRLDGLPGNLIMLSVADTAQSVYPELIVGIPGFTESILKSRLSRFFPFLMARAQIDMSPFASPVEPFAQPSATNAPVFDAELVPDPDDLRPFLFPSVHALAVNDAGIRLISREAIPTLNLSTAVPMALAALVPAIHNAQLSRGRSQSTNNLKQIGLALHNFASADGHFPSDIRGKDGKRLLSWRVAILPFIEQQALFQEFHQDEPWNSPHNKALIARMPATYSVPDGSATEAGLTFYRGFAGNDTLFDPGKADGVKITEITDGTSNTIALVEAKEAVPWTKPESEVPVDADPNPERIRAALDAVGGHFDGGFNALFCDGSVRFIRTTIALPVFRALITRASGEVISSDSF
jgi:prepilin-type processing-associated H-X9-DG protein